MNTIKFKPKIKKIDRLKKRHKVTNRQIAKAQGVSEVWVSYVLHGKGESKPLKEAIARALCVSPEEIFPARRAA